MGRYQFQGKQRGGGGGMNVFFFLLFLLFHEGFLLAVINFRETREVKEKRPRDANATL